MSLKQYSEVDMLNRFDYVSEANSDLDFFLRWVSNCAGRSTLIIQLPHLQKQQLEQFCKTIKVISKKPFSISNLVSYQLVELQRRLELNPNLYHLLRLLKNIEENPPVQRSRENKRSLRKTKIRLYKQQIFSLELTLATMEEQLSKHSFDVETTIELLLLSLCYQMNTQSTKVMYDLLHYVGVENSEIKLYLESKD